MVLDLNLCCYAILMIKIDLLLLTIRTKITLQKIRENSQQIVSNLCCRFFFWGQILVFFFCQHTCAVVRFFCHSAFFWSNFGHSAVVRLETWQTVWALEAHSAG